eukprot:TRINITY_DN1777_c0_g1_i3.p1 TRINITY_DN1777_c0_g1~~TRINITY_DN1777_c0_g1_i3.p1  ORF type:complete len:615 (-),score=64.09 TRINITY_DN1777_c0_g1_i3:1092-2936(-)
MGQSVSRVGSFPIDNNLLKPKVLKCTEERRLKRYIIQGKLAPCYEGVLVEDDSHFQGEECPICFLNFPALNQAMCCSKRICTECFLQVSGKTCLVSDVVCPFCKAPNFSVKFSGPRSKEEQIKEWEENQKAVAAEINASQNREAPLFSEEEINAIQRNRSNVQGGGSSSHRSHRHRRNRSGASTIRLNTAAVQVDENSASDAYDDVIPTPQIQQQQQQPVQSLWTSTEEGVLNMGSTMARMHAGILGGGDGTQSPPGLLTLCRDLGMSLEEINELLLEHAIAASVLQLSQNAQQIREANASQQDLEQQSEQPSEHQIQQDSQSFVNHPLEDDTAENVQVLASGQVGRDTAQSQGSSNLRHRSVQGESSSPSSQLISCWDDEKFVGLSLNEQQQQNRFQNQSETLQSETNSFHLLQQQQEINSDAHFSYSQRTVDDEESLLEQSLDTQSLQVSQDSQLLIISDDNVTQSYQESVSQQGQQFENLNSVGEYSDTQFDSSIDQQQGDDRQRFERNNNIVDDFLSARDEDQNQQIFNLSDSVTIENQTVHQDLQTMSEHNVSSMQQESEEFVSDQLPQPESQSIDDFIDVGDLGDEPPEAIIVQLPDESHVLGLANSS